MPALLALVACLAPNAVGAGIVAEASSGSQRSRSAFDLLAQSMKRECDFNVCALIDQRDPMALGWQRVKVDRDEWGHCHMCVLQPLRMEGIESIDDGVRWQTVLPDDGIVLDYESPSRDASDDQLRLKLARKNYKFDIVGRSEVAGRNVIEVCAKPNRSQMAMRMYSLDAQTLYPLKVENIQDGNSDIEFVTIDVCYPKSMNRDEFRLRSNLGFKVYRFDRPKNVRAPSDARRILGFSPYLPKGCPLGFETQEMQINQDGSWQALVLRLTDGLARATVYEFISGRESVHAMEQSSSRQIDGVNLLVVSPLGEGVREALLDSLSPRNLTRTLSFPSIAECAYGTSTGAASVRKYRVPVWTAAKAGPDPRTPERDLTFGMH